MKKNDLSREEILHLAKLARLHLTEEEIITYQKQISETIDFIKNLDELDIANVEPTNSVVDLKNVTFEDGSDNEKALTHKEALSNAKKTSTEEFKVDRIM